MSLFQDELHVLLGENAAAILWDMEKFYDNISITKLAAKAVQLEYPMTVFTLGLQMHLAPRALKAYQVNRVITELPANGIIAGCTQSNYLARVMLHSVMQGMWERSNGPNTCLLYTSPSPRDRG